MWVPGIILIDPSNPQMICWVRRNRVIIVKHGHVVLCVPRSFSELDVFQKDWTVVQKMGHLITHETAIACSPWKRMVHPTCNTIGLDFWSMSKTTANCAPLVP